MPTSTLTSKGQTTVPKEVREALNLQPGAKLTWEIRGGNAAAQLQGAPRNYAHCNAYSMELPPQPNTGGQNAGESIYCFKPYVEAPSQR